MLLLVLSLAQDAESTATFRSWKPQVGHRAALKAEDVQSNWVKVSRGEAARPIKAEKAHAFEARQEILEVEGRSPTRVRRVYAKATHRKNLWEKPFDFQGAAVLFTIDPDGPREVTREDQKLVSAEDVDILRKSFFDTGLDQGGRRGGNDEPLWPKAPLKVGESADLSPEEAMRLLGGYEFRDGIDSTGSALKVTYQSAATRAGARYATLVFAGRFLLRRFGELHLASPIPMNVTHTVDSCVDGSRPDSTFTVAVEMKGSSDVPLPGGNTGSLEIDIRRDLKYSLRTLAEE